MSLAQCSRTRLKLNNRISRCFCLHARRASGNSGNSGNSANKYVSSRLQTPAAVRLKESPTMRTPFALPSPAVSGNASPKANASCRRRTDRCMHWPERGRNCPDRAGKRPPIQLEGEEERQTRGVRRRAAENKQTISRAPNFVTVAMQHFLPVMSVVLRGVGCMAPGDDERHPRLSSCSVASRWRQRQHRAGRVFTPENDARLTPPGKRNGPGIGKRNVGDAHRVSTSQSLEVGACIQFPGGRQ